MAKPIGAGDLRGKVRFERRVESDDGFGNRRADWIAEFTRRAAITPLKATESVMAARLQGQQPALIIVRYDGDTVRVGPDWRVVEVSPYGAETIFAIRDARDMEAERKWITILAEAGVATG